MTRLLFWLLTASATGAATLPIYLGTYTHGQSGRGIYLTALDEGAGTLGPPALAAATPDPSCLATTRDGRTLVACNEREDTISSFRVDPDGRLTPINVEPSGGKGPAHVALAPDDRAVFVANYAGGTAASLALGTDGTLHSPNVILKLRGPQGPNLRRQSQAHAHSVTFSPATTSYFHTAGGGSVAVAPGGAVAWVCDLGSDRIFGYGRTADGFADLGHPSDAGRIAPVRTLVAPPGSGPRHAVYAAQGDCLYVVNEMAGTICAFRHPGTGSTTPFQTISVLPDGYQGFNGSAEITLSSDGRRIYASSRGPDILTVLSRDAAGGALAVVQRVPCGGAFPRSFALSPNGRWLACALQKSNALALFRVDPGSGRLQAAGITAGPPEPVCVLFARNLRSPAGRR